MKTTTITAVLFLSLSSYAAIWHTERIDDEMTDEVSYLIATEGERIGDGFMSYKPILAARIFPISIDRTTMKLKYKIGMLIRLGSMDGISFSSKSALIRFDKSPAEKWAVRQSNSPSSFFIDDAEPFFKRLIDSSTIKVRIEAIGSILTLTFHVDGLSDEITSVKTTILKTRPKGIEIIDSTRPQAPTPTASWEPTPPTATNAPAAQKPTPPPKPRDRPCPKCRGAGSFYQWKPCPSCNGSTRGCDSCRNSGWIGHTKSMQECPRCKGFGTIKTTSPSP